MTCPQAGHDSSGGANGASGANGANGANGTHAAHGTNGVESEEGTDGGDGGGGGGGGAARRRAPQRAAAISAEAHMAAMAVPGLRGEAAMDMEVRGSGEEGAVRPAHRLCG